MKRYDLIAIIYKLRDLGDDHKNINTNLLFELNGRRYDICLHREDGNVVHFSFTDIGKVEETNEDDED